MRGVRVDIFTVTILFGPEYVTPTSTAKFDFRVRFMRDRLFMRDVN